MHSSVSRSSPLPWSNRPTAALVGLAWPIAVSTLSYTAMTLVSTLFVAHIGEDELAGVGLGGIVAFALMCFGIGMLRGVKTLVSQAIGAGRPQDADLYLGAGMAIALGFGLVMLTLAQLVAPLIAMIPAEADAGRHAATYLRLRALTGPILLAYVALRETRYAEGDPRGPMRSSLIANLVNIGLDAVLILGFGWGVAGAAVASVIANCVECGSLAWPHRARLRALTFCREAAWKVWRQGVPTGVQFVMEVGSFLLLSTLIARMSSNDAAAHQIVLQVTHVSFLPAHAIAEAASVMVGQAVGANRDDLVRRVGLRALAIAAIYSAMCSVVFGLGAGVVASLFATGALWVTARTLLRISVLFLIADAANVIARAVLRGAGDVRYPAVVGVLTAWAMTPPTTWLLGMHFGWGAAGGWIGLSAEIILGAGLFWRRLINGTWREAAATSRRVVAAGAAVEITDDEKPTAQADAACVTSSSGA